MRKIIGKYRNELLSIPLSSKNEEKIRENVHLITTNISLDLKKGKIKDNDPEICSVISDCLNRLKKLQIMTIAETKEIELFNCRIDLFLAEICAAADLILSLKNKRVKFSVTPVLSALCPPLLRDAVLILIAGAAKDNNRILLTIRKSRSQILIITETAKNSIDRDTDDLYTVNHIMTLHGGNMFFSQSKNKFKAILSLPIINGNYNEYPMPDFAEYVCNKVSPVRIMLE